MRTLLSALFASVLTTAAFAQTAPSAAPATTPAPPQGPTAEDLASYPKETPEQKDARMKWWREARFGMFIHWGIYSVPAGAYEGKPVAGIGEWIMLRAAIPVDTYAGYAKQFNPTKFNAEEWVRLAKAAGQKYIVITSKHHDGFAMFASKASPYNIVDATPFKRDPLKELAEACKKHDIKLGFYYSQAQDWHHPGGANWRKEGNWDEKQKGDYDKYLDDVAVPQVKEILMNYGPVAVLWFDTPKDMTPARAAKFLPLLKLQPGIVVNNRLGGFKGDTETPEQKIPATGFADRDWETCMTINDTWGYKSTDHNWKSTEKLLRNLIDIASKGGNYLLNVGPTAEGEIPPESVARLKEMGAWLKTNGEAVYGTSASPFATPPAYRCTQKREGENTALYIHVFEWPQKQKETVKFVLPLMNEVKAPARLLADPGRTAAAQAGRGGLSVTVEGDAPDKIASVIKVVIEGTPKVIAAPDNSGKQPGPK